MSNEMSTYVPFPELANAMHGATVWQVIYLVRDLGDIMTVAYKAKKYQAEQNIVFSDEGVQEAFLQSETHRWPQDGSAAFHAIDSIDETEDEVEEFDDFPPPSLLPRLDPVNTCNFLYANLDKIEGDPDRVFDENLYDSKLSVAEHWIYMCVLHPDSGLDENSKRLWSSFITVQPVYAPRASVQYRYEVGVFKFEDPESSTWFPGLELTLRSFISPDNFDEVGVAAILLEYVALGASAASIWMHIWQRHGILRGEALPEHEYHLANAMQDVQEQYSFDINDWSSVMPLHVRQELANHNLSGDFLFLMNHVFPNVIAPADNHIRESLFGWEMYKYIVNAVTTPEVDPSGQIANLIRQQAWFVDPSGEPRHNFYTRSARLIVDFHQQDEELEAVELEAYGPNIEVDDITTTPKQALAENAMCTICQDGFDCDADGESRCVQLNACEHLFHCECLGFWVNGVHHPNVLCPNCRTAICRARPRRRKQ